MRGNWGYHRRPWDFGFPGGMLVVLLKQELGLAQVRLRSRSHAPIRWGGVNLRCCWDLRSGERLGRQSKGQGSAVRKGGQNHINN